MTVSVARRTEWLVLRINRGFCRLNCVPSANSCRECRSRRRAIVRAYRCAFANGAVPRSAPIPSDTAGATRRGFESSSLPASTDSRCRDRASRAFSQGNRHGISVGRDTIVIRIVGCDSVARLRRRIQGQRLKLRRVGKERHPRILRDFSIIG